MGTLLVYAATRDWYAANGLDPEYYLKRHIINIVIGSLLAWGTTVIDYRLLRAYTPIVWAAGVVGLIAVLIPGIGSTVNGAQAWIALPGGFQVQPAELAKISIIVGLSMILSERTHDSDAPSSRDVMQALVVAGIPIIFILLQPDMGTVFIISVAVVTIIAASGAPLRWVVGLLLIALLGGIGAAKLGVISEYQVKRLQSFVDPNADTQGSGYQLRQARITVGSGGLIGTGLFNGPQTNGRFVPEQQTDFIFTVAGEELGFLGSGFILILYLIILMRAFGIARRSADPYGRLVCIGVIAWFAFQAFENIGMTLGMMPMTGVPLPFVSYGGSSMFANMIGFGLLQNVHARQRG
jgi:rod shape determining protein RodA